jgi:hypothetical protein
MLADSKEERMNLARGFFASMNMECIPYDVLVAHNVYVASDNPFQQRARLLQALWRDGKNYSCGKHRGLPLGSRLMAYDADRLHNFLSENIQAIVRDEVLNKKKSEGKLYGRPRIFNDLLSSQPLCFNLFSELKFDKLLATNFSKFGAITCSQSPSFSIRTMSTMRGFLSFFIHRIISVVRKPFGVIVRVLPRPQQRSNP